jgi:hypothetical protein
MEKQTEAVWHEPESAEPTTTAPIVGFVPEFNSMWEYSRDGKLRTLNSGQYLTSESYKQIRKIMSSISKTRTLYITLKSGKTFKTEDYDLTRHGIYSFRSYPTQTRQLSWEELENYKQTYDYSTLYPFSDIKCIIAQVGGTVLFNGGKVVYTPSAIPTISKGEDN